MVVITRRRATKEQKYRKALAIVEEISSLHCINTLCSQNSEYKKTNDPDLRSTSSLYKKYIRNQKIVRIFESTEEFTFLERRRQQLLIRPKCDNCQRQQPLEIDNDDPYKTLYVYQSSFNIVNQRKFKFDTANTRNVVNYTLCNECNIHLTSGDNDVANEIDTIWPVFIWGLLKDQSVHLHYGVYKFLVANIVHNLQLKTFKTRPGIYL